jgi:hypothetical protein
MTMTMTMTATLTLMPDAIEPGQGEEPGLPEDPTS